MRLLLTGTPGFVGHAPNTSIEEGMARFVAWYREYFQK